MRDIIFKAKRKDNGEWVKGDLLRETDVFENVITRIYVMKNHHTFIKHEVVPETVSQYTGLTDKNGNRIWENDIVKTKFFGKDDGRGHNFSDYDKFVVKWHDSAFVLENDKRRFYFHTENKAFEVIGNVFDNADLLKESEK